MSVRRVSFNIAYSRLSKTFSKCFATQPINLKDVLSNKIVNEQKTIGAFRKEHGNKKFGEYTIDQIYGGMRGITGLVTETSLLDPEEGIRFRGYSLPECQKLLPKAANGSAPLPEGIFWLMITGSLPNEHQVSWLTKEWNERADIPSHVSNMLNSFPSTLHPMSQFAAAVIALNTESKFKSAYAKGIKKTLFWEYTYEDAMDLIAKLPIIASIIYRNLYREGSSVGALDVNKDWAENFSAMLGYDTFEFSELLRLYLTIHVDHEGGNVSAHSTHLVASALSDPYLAFGAGMCGLAGPLHGLANQVAAAVGSNPTDEVVTEYIWSTLKAGQVVPGYGHAVLRKTDPRFTIQHEFAEKNLPNDEMYKLVRQIYKLAPGILTEQGKTKNPYPNVDAHSGVLLQHYGLKEMQYYTVLFGVSRALGVMSSLVWDRALGLPIERPKSITSDALIKKFA